MADRVLTLTELNRATLARQLLLERRSVPLVRALERVAGLQAQWGPAPYVGLWTRIAGFRRSALERALVRRQAVRAVLMRGTIHLVSLADYVRFGAAVGTPPWLRPEAAALGDELHDAIRAFGESPRTRQEIFAYLASEHGIEKERAETAWYALRIRGRLTHAPETGYWKTTGLTRYVTIAHDAAQPEAARVELVRRYLGAFGPATRADVSEWSGLRVRDLEPALGALEPLARFRDERGRELLDLPRAPRPSADTPAPVRLMPRFDNLILSHKDRNRVLADEHRGLVIDGGWVKSTFLVGGFVAGTWEVEDGRIRLEPFTPLSRAATRDLKQEAASLEAWLAA
ncbi:MAG TPA: winged helix DNA-binding domain-containing protein [Gaiellaceae bacterium]|nr:winged helix DNA-binding domain-containing protein [Gaiellaceae bacterium]